MYGFARLETSAASALLLPRSPAEREQRLCALTACSRAQGEADDAHPAAGKQRGRAYREPAADDRRGAG